MIALLITIGIAGWIFTMFLCAAMLDEIWIIKGFNFLRPDIIYHNTKLNYFGVGVTCLALNLFCLPLAFCYWFYKLCTIGRK